MTSSLTSEAFAEAYRKGLRQTVGFLLTKGANLDLAEELAQTAWARGWEARDQLQLETRIQPWINTIAFHRLCNFRRGAVLQAPLPTDVPDSLAPDASAVIDATLLLARCSPFERALLKERYVDGLEMKEIAATKGLSEIAVRLRIHRCQRALRSIAVEGPRRVRKFDGPPGGLQAA